MPTYAETLSALREDLDRAHQRLAQLMQLVEPKAATATERACEPAEQAAFLEAILRSRRALESALGQGNFGDPRRDILIELYLASLIGRSVSVSELGVAAAVPHATALRHIQQLGDEGLIHRIPDVCDGRRTYIRLSAQAEREMREWTLVTRNAVQKAMA